MSCRVFYNQPTHQSFFGELEKQFYNELLKSKSKEVVERFYTPNSNIIEQADSFIIELELAGVNKQDIKIDIEKSNLIISGENKRKSSSLTNTDNNKITSSNTTITESDKPSIEDFEEVESTNITYNKQLSNNAKPSEEEKPQQEKPSTTKYQYLTREIESGKFKKVISIKNQYLDLENINATFENGILSIKLLKKDPVSLKVNIF
ncbi:heat shock protein Hsp20 domain-containing protein [Tieghemostelium lacteum]|uniref:Heat shock protein Hsp20 domain-containing protein n=1 Tax=Tieghemostelium lacteum TaxID=361077 RepID=A0A151ZRV9_TIELA|nr:heat shock protein Hsp20 domain-containing protein [Tieghemostelium lacteum]|eukprot:KYQ96717.1 heat shock protein Hsp20 domain-containing protein [Tieghemostelium lacteum]